MAASAAGVRAVTPRAAIPEAVHSRDADAEGVMFSPRTMHRITALTEKEEDLSQMLDRVRVGACKGPWGAGGMPHSPSQLHASCPSTLLAPAAWRPLAVECRERNSSTTANLSSRSACSRCGAPLATAERPRQFPPSSARSAFWTNPACFFRGATVCSGCRSARRCSGRSRPSRVRSPSSLAQRSHSRPLPPRDRRRQGNV